MDCKHFTENLLEAGTDEVARGCLAGPVYAAAVIMPRETLEETPYILRDSKKLNRAKRNVLRDYIEENAIDFSVASVDNDTIDKVNILNASHMAMHKAIDGLNVEPEFLLVDGHRFDPYFNSNGELIEHKCFVGGDDLYTCISAASILAKVYHDDYIDNLLQNEPGLCVYEWDRNMCYGTKGHLDAIREHGISKYHRKTFGICKKAKRHATL